MTRQLSSANASKRSSRPSCTLARCLSARSAIASALGKLSARGLSSLATARAYSAAKSGATRRRQLSSLTVPGAL